ncbi:hypothetical protein D3C77_459860 [compost metagenome]
MVPVAFTAVRPISIKDSTATTSAIPSNGNPTAVNTTVVEMDAGPGTPATPMDEITLTKTIKI